MHLKSSSEQALSWVTIIWYRKIVGKMIMLDNHNCNAFYFVCGLSLIFNFHFTYKIFSAAMFKLVQSFLALQPSWAVEYCVRKIVMKYFRFYIRRLKIRKKQKFTNQLFTSDKIWTILILSVRLAQIICLIGKAWEWN